MKTLYRIAALAIAGSAVIAASPAMAATTTINAKTTSGLMLTGIPKTLKPGKYIFKYTNTSGLDHNLMVGSVSTPTFAKGTKSITVTLKKGTVSYMCSVPGHAAGGMKGTITVK
ncbi:MAG: plastocyanin/azurin family copper-binding protein [Actinobacteria bacterium]|nr:plastocyanin/azurin family copper-binding protein [Actinomycetota bacterium]